MYNYEEQKKDLFTDAGQKKFLEVRDLANKFLNQSKAFRMDAVMVSGDSWQIMACIDRMIELGEIREVTDKNIAGQHRVFVRGNG